MLQWFGSRKAGAAHRCIDSAVSIDNLRRNFDAAFARAMSVELIGQPPGSSGAAEIRLFYGLALE